jgi:hypothetical protein
MMLKLTQIEEVGVLLENDVNSISSAFYEQL